jgi:hypothetical protein
MTRRKSSQNRQKNLNQANSPISKHSNNCNIQPEPMTQTHRNMSDFDALEQLIRAIRLRANASLEYDGQEWNVIIVT